MPFFIFAANWHGQEDNVRVIVQARDKAEAIKKAQEQYPGFYYTQCIPTDHVIF